MTMRVLVKQSLAAAALLSTALFTVACSSATAGTAAAGATVSSTSSAPSSSASSSSTQSSSHSSSPTTSASTQSDDATVVLRPCPFLNLAGDDPDVICRLHAGLANGLLGPDQPWRVTDIEPFATPTTCVLRLQHLAAAEPSEASDHVA